MKLLVAHPVYTFWAMWTVLMAGGIAVAIAAGEPAPGLAGVLLGWVPALIVAVKAYRSRPQVPTIWKVSPNIGMSRTQYPSLPGPDPRQPGEHEGR